MHRWYMYILQINVYICDRYRNIMIDQFSRFFLQEGHFTLPFLNSGSKQFTW